MSPRKNGFPRSMASRLARLFVASAAIGAGLLVGAPASAASLTGPISGWQKGTEPSWISMYEYVPTNARGERADPRARPLLRRKRGGRVRRGAGGRDRGGRRQVRLSHGACRRPPRTAGTWRPRASLTHNGGGDTGAIVDQVKYSISKHNANANRVYVTGTSSGAMMAEGLLAVYPDVFKGRLRVRGRSSRMLVRQRSRRAVERPVRGRSGHAHGGGVGNHGSQHVPRVLGISPPCPALARAGGHHHQLHEPDRGHQGMDQRLGAERRTRRRRRR